MFKKNHGFSDVLLATNQDFSKKFETPRLVEKRTIAVILFGSVEWKKVVGGVK